MRSERRRIWNGLLFAVLLIVLLFVSGGGAATYTVCPGGGCDCISIQAAIQNATDGDTIEVHSGTYYEHDFWLFDQITLRGIDTGGGKPVVDAKGYVDVFDLRENGITVDGFTLINPGLHAIYVSSNNNIIINNDISNCGHVGIWLDNVTNNNTLTGNTVSNNDHGIVLFSSNNNNILTGNTVSNNNQHGIFLGASCNNNILTGNTVSKNNAGISLNSSSDNILTGNTANSNNDAGIALFSSNNNNILTGNTANSNNVGIYMNDSSDNNLTSNTASDNDYGICLYASNSNNILTGNTVSNNNQHGIFLGASCNNNILTGNTATSNNDCGISLDSSSNNNLTSNTANSNDYGIWLYASSNNNILTGNTASDNYRGISLDSSSNNNLTSNTANSNDDSGILLYASSDNNILTGNTANSNNFSGILLYASSNNNLANNAASDNYHSIYLDLSSDNILTGNNASDNVNGLFLYSSSYNNNTGNTANSNNQNGIYLDSSSNNNILIGNTANYNNNYGISLYASNNNLISNNYFNNTNNAYDDGINTWNITKTAGLNIVGGLYLGGNYWSDYNGTDIDGDKLGDTFLPYNCSGNIQFGGDWHPLIIIPKIILKASKDGYASVIQELANDQNFEEIVISGMVTDESTGKPIKDAKVEIVLGANLAAAYTDATGNYTITAIIPDGSGSDTRDDVNFELPPAQYVVGVYEISSETAQLIEDNKGVIIDYMDYGDIHRAYLVEITKEEEIDPFIINVSQSTLVNYVELGYVVELEYVPNDPRYSLQWGPRRIRAGGLPNPSAWDYETGSRSIKIAILDTAVQYDHPDLYLFEDGKPKYVYGYDWVNEDDDPYPSSDPPGLLPIDIIRWRHGTHVAGIATAVIDNSEGIAGIAPNCSFMVEEVIGGGAIQWAIAQGIYDAAIMGADVISMSLSYGWESSTLVENACNYAWYSDCILVAAAGNQYGGLDVFTSPKIRYPAAHDTVIAVGAINSYDQKAAFSNWGEGLELVAPGVDILSTVQWDTYDYMNGTSMATPHVAGVAALLKSRAACWPEEPLATEPRYHLNNAQIRKILRLTAEDIGEPGWDNVFGYGVVNAERALRCVNISGSVLEAVLNAPVPHSEVRLTSIEGPPGTYTTNEGTYLANITSEGDYYVRVPPGVYSICAMAYGYIPSEGLGGDRLELPAFNSITGQLYKDNFRNFRLLPLPLPVSGNVKDNLTGMPISGASVSLDGPPHIIPPYATVHMDTSTNTSGNYSFILEYGIVDEGLYNITVSKQGYQNQTQNFTLNWSAVVTDYYKCPLDPRDWHPPIVNFSLQANLPDLTLASDDIQVILPATLQAIVHNIGPVEASNIVVQFFDGDPAASGTQLGSDQTIASISAGGTGHAEVSWDISESVGMHSIYVRIDPLNKITESHEGNNLAFRDVGVPGVTCSDPAVSINDDGTSVTDDPAGDGYNVSNAPANVDLSSAKGFMISATGPNGTYGFNITFSSPISESFRLFKLPNWTELPYNVLDAYTIQVQLAVTGGELDPAFILAPVAMFDTREPANPYPSISGTFKGTIRPTERIPVGKLYTYPCVGTSGHAEYAAISYPNGTVLAEATWNGYKGDWHNLTFNTSFILYANETYNYTICTGSYPQIIHEPSWNATGGVITCTEFVDLNGKRHDNWIPAITLWSD